MPDLNKDVRGTQVGGFFHFHYLFRPNEKRLFSVTFSNKRAK